MVTVLDVATLLGGITALWFFYDKRAIILNWFNWFRLYRRNYVNPLALPDEDFEFFSKAAFFPGSEYLPVNVKEKELCISLTNHGVLKESNGTFKLTRQGKRMYAGRTKNQVTGPN